MTLARLASIALLAAALAGCGSDPASAPTPGPKAQQRQVPSRASAVERLEAVECRAFPAQVESRNSVTLASKVSGSVVEVLAREGQTLRAGDPVLRIDDRDLQSREQGLKASLAQAASERQAVAARAAHARANLDRLSRLVTQRVISQDDFEKARTEYQALAREEEASAARERAVAAQQEELKALWAYTRVVAPFDGVLARRYVDQGAFVAAGQALALVDEMGASFELTAQVDESLLPTLTAGQQVLAVVPALSPRPFAARVSAVVGRVDPGTRTFKLKVDLPPLPDGARPQAGMFARVFVPARTASKLLLPQECLRLRGDVPVAFVLGQDNVASLRVVKPGGRFLKVELEGRPYITDSEAFDASVGQGYVEVLSGLDQRERVASARPATLRDGDRVLPEAECTARARTITTCWAGSRPCSLTPSWCPWPSSAPCWPG